MSERQAAKLTAPEVGYLAGLLHRTELHIDRNGKAWFTNPVNQQIHLGYDLATGRKLDGWG